MTHTQSAAFPEGNVAIYAYVVAEALVSILVMSINAVVLLAMWNFLSLRNSTTSCFMGALALGDFLVGFSTPFYIFPIIQGVPRDNRLLCLFLNCLWHVFTNISAYNMLMLAVERFVAVVFPFTYRNLTQHKAFKVVAVVWTTAIFLGFLPMMLPASKVEGHDFEICEYMDTIDNENLFYATFFGVNLVSVVAIAVLHSYVMYVARETRLIIAHKSLSKVMRRKFHSERRELQGGKTLALTIIALLVLCMPAQVVNILLLTDQRFPNAILPVTVVLNHMNSFVNPVLYTLCYKKYRTAVMWVLCKEHRLSIQPDYSTDSSPSDFNVDSEIRRMTLISQWSEISESRRTSNSNSSKRPSVEASLSARLSHHYLNKVRGSVSSVQSTEHDSQTALTEQKVSRNLRRLSLSETSRPEAHRWIESDGEIPRSSLSNSEMSRRMSLSDTHKWDEAETFRSNSRVKGQRRASVSFTAHTPGFSAVVSRCPICQGVLPSESPSQGQSSPTAEAPHSCSSSRSSKLSKPAFVSFSEPLKEGVAETEV